jgi:uncharacterized membrane protein SpoIIM required for sporulation
MHYWHPLHSHDTCWALFVFMCLIIASGADLAGCAVGFFVSVLAIRGNPLDQGVYLIQGMASCWPTLLGLLIMSSGFHGFWYIYLSTRFIHCKW